METNKVTSNIEEQTPEGITEIIIDEVKLEIYNKEIYLILEDTIQTYFKENEITKFPSEKELLSYFFTNEKNCISKIKTFESIKKKFYKSIIYESIFEIFKLCPEAMIIKIFEKLNKIEKELNKKDLNLNDFYKSLEDNFGTKNIPKFLIRKDIKNIKFKEKIRKKEESILQKIIGYYKKLLDNNIKPFEMFEYKKILFNIFVLSNAKDIGSNKMIEEIFFVNFDEIQSWFGLNNDLKNYQNILTNYIDINEIEHQSLLESFFTQLNIELTKLNNKNEDLFLFLIASFFYCIMHRMYDLQKSDNKINDINSKVTIFLKNIIDDFSKYIKIENYNLKSLINLLFDYVFNNNKNENTINDNNTKKDYINIFSQEENIDYDFLLIEEIISHCNDNNLKDRFQQIKSKFKLESTGSTGFSSSLIGGMIQKVTSFLTSNAYYHSNYISLSPFQKYKTSNIITILVSGFGSENDRFWISWEKYIENDPSNSTYYFYQWPSESLVKIITKSLPTSFSQISNLPKLFTDSKLRASYSGKLLSIILQSKKFFPIQKINLVGFSLGCHVIKHCIKELSNSEQGKNIINNVIFLGGATNFKNKLKWYNNFTKIVKGRIVNCHSNNDEVLKKLVKNCNGKDPIGADKFDINDGRGGKNIIENYDFTDLKLGHLDYRKNLNIVLKRINED